MYSGVYIRLSYMYTIILKGRTMICPKCASDLEPYGLPDVHTHWCEDCGHGLILKDHRWISIEEAERLNSPLIWDS